MGELKRRQAEVLDHLVRDYVSTGIPVGSKRLSGRLGVSPATVRNAMLELNERGYLEKPHHSSGRVPTDRGYRYFVDYLLKEFRIAEESGQAIQKSLDPIRYKIDQLFRRVSQIISDWSNCVSFIAVPEEDQSEVRKLEITRVSSHSILLVLVLSNGMVESSLVHLPVEVDRLPLDRFRRAFNSRLCGLKISDISAATLDHLFNEIKLKEEYMHSSIASFFSDMLAQLGTRMYIEGGTRLIRHPEFHDPDRFQPVVDVIESAKVDSGIFTLTRSAEELAVTIGSENRLEELYDCSIIKSNFTFGDYTSGTIGILGPRRMEYSGMMGLVDFVSASLSEVFKTVSRF